jgi:hypothetical protein
MRHPEMLGLMLVSHGVQTVTGLTTGGTDVPISLRRKRRMRKREPLKGW